MFDTVLTGASISVGEAPGVNIAFYELLDNLAILSMLVLIWSNARFSRLQYPPVVHKLAFGLLLGAGAIIVMLRPFEIEKGVLIDLRTTLVAVSGLRRVTAALTNMADGLVMFDKDLNLVFCNYQYRGMFALTADLRIPGTPAASILYASIARGELISIPTDDVTEWVNKALASLRQPGTVQFPLFDGRWIESRTRPAADGTCFVVCSDITQGKQSEQALRNLNMRLAELAETDGLTGLLNRRAFDAVLGQEIERVGRGEGPLSILLLDVDRFKAFNDTYGHTAGDACLRAIADCLRSVAHRSADRAARYGGEEMVLVLPNTPEDGAVAVAHDLRNRLRALHIAHTGSEKGIVTASIGVATLANHTIGHDAGRLVVRADEALYLAKGAGRDLVRTWEPARPKLVGK